MHAKKQCDVPHLDTDDTTHLIPDIILREIIKVVVRLTDPGQLEDQFIRVSVCTFKCNLNIKLSEF